MKIFIINGLNLLMMINTNYIIRINNIINQAVILFPYNKDYTRKINIISKKLILKNKEICLSNYVSLYSELHHLELIIKFNNNS